MDSQYPSGNESDGSLEDKGGDSAIFLYFYLLNVMDEETGRFCLSILCANLFAKNIPWKSIMIL